MLVNVTGFYIPEERVGNRYFLELGGSTGEWIEQQTGIHTRSKAKEGENINTMSLETVKGALPKLPYDITEVDLTVSASYSLYDTVATAAYTVQHEYTIADAKALYLSSTCSSFLSALEVVEGYFTMRRAFKALILSVDKNSAYHSETDPKAGHLWGDAAAAFFISRKWIGGGDVEIVKVYAQGLDHLSKAMEAVHLYPRDGGILMPERRDVFIQACTYMPKSVSHLLEKDSYTLDNLAYFIGHQADVRIMANIVEQLNLPNEKFLHSIEELGNTGSVGSALVYVQNDESSKKNGLIAIAVFGSGYSTGTCLIKH